MKESVFSGLSSKEIVEFLCSSSKIDMSELADEYIEMENSKYLEQHYGKDWKDKLKKGNDGRYATRLPGGKQIRKTDKGEFIKCIVSYYSDLDNKTVRNGKCVRDIFYEWIADKKDTESMSKATLDRYEADFKRFFIKNPDAEEIMLARMDSVDENMLERFLKITIKNMKLDSKAWGKFRFLIRSIWAFAMKKGYTSINFEKFIFIVGISPRLLTEKVKDDEEDVFTDEEAKEILDFIENRGYSPHNCGIALAFYTGMRIGELSGLKWGDVREDLSLIRVNHMETLCNDENGVKREYSVVDHAKTKAGIRKVIIPNVAIPYLEALKEHTGDNEFVFTDEKGNRLHARSFTDKLYRICKQIGIQKRSMHKIRKTTCSKLLDAGADEKIILKQIGHTDKKTTEAFYHRDRRTEKEKRDIINKALSY